MIETIFFDEATCSNLGLRGGELHGLRDLVVLTGPNGHGKSRYLRVLATQWQKLRRYRNVLLQHLGVENRSIENLTDAEGEILFLGIVRAFLNDGDDARVVQARAEFDQRLARLHLDADTYRKIRLSYRTIQAIRLTKELPKIVLISHSRVTDVSQCYEMRNLTSRAESYLHEVAKRIYMREHPGYRRTHAAQLEELDSFQEMLKALLGIEVEVREIDERMGQVHVPPYLFGRKLDLAELSEGQRNLLGWAILIHEEGGKLRDSILLFDEPELHLHPDACIQAIERLRGLGAGQIWIATHCLPFLAYAGADRIFSVVDGAIAYAGNRIIEAQGALVGGREGRERLRTFLADADAVAFAMYSAQCLIPPESVAAREGDPQPGMLLSSLQQRLAAGETQRVLEYAAGQGRIAQAIAGVPAEARAGLHYYAYNNPDFSSDDERKLCREHVEALGQQGGEAYYLEDLRRLQVAAAEKMDAVLLCNVLHEIPHDQWILMFRSIAEVLAPDGRLIVMEDQRMTIGELPHARGFLVLDRVELAELFATVPDALRQVTRRGERLTLVEIPRAVLGCVSPETIQAALKLLADRALAGVQRCRRSGEGGQANGREHAYFTMLYANAHMALRTYTGGAI